MPKKHELSNPRCVKCGNVFSRIVECQITHKPIKVGRKVGSSYVCGYCAEILFGAPDASWLGELPNTVNLPRGMQKI